MSLKTEVSRLSEERNYYRELLNNRPTETKALHIADVSKRFSFEQQKAVKYIIDELFDVLRGEYGIKINEKVVDRAFDDIAKNVFS